MSETTNAMRILFAVAAAGGALLLSEQGLTLSEELRVDEYSGGGPLSWISSIAVDPQGWLYLADWREAQILVFTDKGSFVRRIGQRGAGPGDFQTLGKIGFVGAELWAADPAQHRITLFAKDGKITRTVSTLDIGSGAMYSPLALQSVDTIVASQAIGVDQMVGRQLRQALVRITHGTVIDTLAVLPSPKLVRVRAGRTTRYVPDPFSPKAMLAAAPDWREFAIVEWTARADSGLRITRLMASQPSRTISLPLAGVRITKRIVDSLLLIAASGSQQLATIARDSVAIPEFLTPVSSAFLTSNGDVWLELVATSGSSRWMVVDQHGSVAGSVRLPSRAAPLLEADGKVYVRVLDSDDTPAVVRYAVRKTLKK